jgi:uncharacterized RmlC-like cupin family protein
MRQLLAILSALAFVTCGGAPPAALATASPAPTASPTPSPTPTPDVTYAPTAEGFSSKVLAEKPRNVAASVPGYIWIKSGGAPDAAAVSASVTDGATYSASYEASTQRVVGALYTTADLPPLAAGKYTEGLRLIVVQPGGRSNAHMHSGIEGVLVLEGSVLVRSGGNAPARLAPGQGFYILPKVPVQLINVGTAVARTLVYSISPEGQPFSTELDKAP